MLTDVVIEDDRWRAAGIGALAERAASAALAHFGLDPSEWEIALLACDDIRIAALNAGFRDADRPTNVLSWPAAERGGARAGTAPEWPDPGDGPELGDIAIAYDTCAREAAQAGRPLSDHVTHLIVHATLHLLGYDHIRDQDATLMERCEVDILGKLGVCDPY